MKHFDEANKKSEHLIRNPNWGKGKIMKNKPLDRGSRRFLYGDELQCVVWWRFGQAKDGTTPKEEAEGTARTLSSSKLFCSGDLCGGGGGSA